VLNAITDVEGIRVGHASDLDGYTGCTALIFDGPATCGIDVRGSAAGTRQVDALGAAHVVEEVHAILLSGGSAFGLDAAAGVMRYLEEKGIGFDVGVAKVPIVPTAVIFDLGFGNSKVRPTPEMGYGACLNAGRSVEEGSVGAGTGATVGKLYSKDRSMKGGIGTASVSLPDGVVVGALVVVNSFGDILDNMTGKIIAGARVSEEDTSFAGTADAIKRGDGRRQFGIDNTTLAVVATNVRFSKREITKVAQMAQGGLIKTISPVHTTFDGDLIFAVSLGEAHGDVNRIGVLGEFVISEAIKRAVKKADGFGKLPAFRDIAKGSKSLSFRKG
jgi:L-aminopeptidase/D-esterase-like protein